MRNNRKTKSTTKQLKVIPVGGLNEIGKNITILEYKDEMIIIDCGLSFPDDEMYGIDIVIPDFTYIIKNSEKIKGIILTHGHEDHIGAIPYLLKVVNLPVYGTRLTLGLVESKLKEHKITAELNTVKPGDKLKFDKFEVEMIRSTHSIADSLCLYITTPAGRVFHTGDFKIDYTPVDGEPIDFSRLAEIGAKGVTLMLADSTNSVRTGFSASEKAVGTTLENIFRSSESRIIIATFSSNVHRVQKIIDNAVLCGRRVAISGRSMVNVVNLATELGYLKIPANVIIDINAIKQMPDKELLIITTGSQGEPMSALTRMANHDHKHVAIKPGDTVIISATPIPGNEKSVARTVDQLFKLGANVIYESADGMHVSGHASQEEQKLMLSMVRPKFFMPVHGEYRMLIKHAQLAEDLGIPRENIFITENGGIVEFNRHGATMAGKVTAGKILIDGLGVGDVGNIVLRDRKQLSQDGILVVVMTISRSTGNIVAGPDVVTRGFVYVREAESMLDEARQKVKQTMTRCRENGITEWAVLKNQIRDSLSKQFYEKTRRRPMILPIIQEVE